MGVWNETDGLTQLPIAGDTPIKLFVILPMRESFGVDGYKGHTKQLTPAAHPVFLPVSGIYDEYGGIKDIKPTVATRYISACIKELHEEDRLIISSRHRLYHEGKDLWEIGTALRTISQGHYTFKAYTYDADRELSMIEFEKTMAETQQLLKEYEIEVPAVGAHKVAKYNLQQLEAKEKMLKSRTIDLKFGLFFVIEDLYNAAVAKMRRLNKRDTQTIGGWCVYHDHLHKSIKNRAKSLKSKAKNGKLAGEDIRDFFGVNESLMGSMCCANPSVVDFTEFLLKQDPVDIRQAIDEMADYKYFRTFMSAARKPWYSAADHRGSQDYEIYLHHALAKATDKYCREQIAQAIKDHE